MVSVHNPFRTPTVTPTPTGRTERTSPPLPPIPADDASTQTSYAPPPGPPPEVGVPPSSPPGAAGGSVAELLTEELELPPAYTASPNIYEGETTLELGPRKFSKDLSHSSSRDCAATHDRCQNSGSGEPAMVDVEK